MFRTPERDIHIHVFSSGSSEIERALTFRDRLRNNVADRKRHEETKSRLAKRSWPSTEDYAIAKTDIVESIIAAARADGEVSQ